MDRTLLRFADAVLAAACASAVLCQRDITPLNWAVIACVFVALPSCLDRRSARAAYRQCWSSLQRFVRLPR